MKAPPGFLGIEVSLVETRLERFNDDGDAVEFKFKLRVAFKDPRIALLDGDYRLSQVDASALSKLNSWRLPKLIKIK